MKHSTVVTESLGLVSSAAKLDGDIDDLKVKVKKLEEDMTSLREQDVMTAFNLIKENVELAKQHQQKVANSKLCFKRKICAHGDFQSRFSRLSKIDRLTVAFSCFPNQGHKVRGILDNSTALRNEASHLLDRQQSAFNHVYTVNEDLMRNLDADINELERSVPEINRHVSVERAQITEAGLDLATPARTGREAGSFRQETETISVLESGSRNG